jgi:hypothetical protein
MGQGPPNIYLIIKDNRFEGKKNKNKMDAICIQGQFDAIL